MQFQSYDSYEHPIMLRSFTEALLAKESTGNCERRRQNEAVEDGFNISGSIADSNS